MGVLQGKLALVTGGSRGIGAATSRALAAEGAAVAVNYAGNREKADAVVKDITGRGGKAFAIQADIGDPGSVEKLFAAVDKEFGGKLDTLVNNAGLFEMAPVTETTLEDFDRLMRVNVRGVFDVTRHAVKRLRDGGRIVTVGSVMGDRGMMPGSSLYGMTKAAVAGLTRGWAHDLAARGITANCVQPGPINTDMNPDSEENPGADMMKGMTAMKRYGTPAEVAAIVAFLARPEAQYVTGQTLTVDGGMMA